MTPVPALPPRPASAPLAGSERLDSVTVTRPVWKYHCGEDRKRRRWSLRRFEQWLTQHGLTVLDDGADEQGEYVFVTTDDPELQKAINARNATR